MAKLIVKRIAKGWLGETMGRLAAKRSTTAIIVILLVSIVPARAASDDAIVTAAADNALSRFEEAGLVPLTDDELAYITDPRTPRKAPSASSILGRQLPDAREVSRSLEDPSALGFTAEENSGLKLESGVDAPPKTSGRSAVEEEPDPRAVIDWLLKRIR